MKKAQTLQERVLKGSFITLTLTLLGSIFAYLIRILFSHTLTIEDYGLFYATFGLFSIIGGYGDLGFGYAIVYLLPKYLKKQNYSRVWNIFVYGQVISYSISIIVSIILSLSAPILAKYYFKVAGSETLIYIFCIYLLSFTVLSGLIQIFSGMQKEKYYSSITVSRWFLTFTFSILFFLFDFPNIIFYAVSWALGHVLTAIIFLVLFFRKHSYISKNKIIWDGAILKQMFSYAYPVFLENLVATSMVFTETFFLTLLRGVKEVGVYNIIYPLTMVSIILLAPINALVLPLVSHLMEGEKKKIRYLVNRILEVVPFVGLYFSLFLIIFPSNIVGLVFGQKWLGLVETPIIILSIGSIGFLMSEIVGTVAIGTGKIRERMKANVVLAVFSVALDIFLIWKYGVLGVVITISLVRFALTIWCLRIIRSSISFNIPYKFYFKILIFSVLLYSAIKFTGLFPKNWFELIISGMIYTLLFMLLGFALKIYDKRLILLIMPGRKISKK